MLKNSVLLLTLVIGSSVVHAEIKPNGLFTDNVVLQQGKEVPIWGTAREGEAVTVEIAGQKATTIAKDGKWMVRLKNLPVGGPYTLTMKGDNIVTANNVLVGEVWVISGQSNMARTLVPPDSVQPRHEFWKQEADAANYPHIRHFRVGGKPEDQPASEIVGQWEICSPQTAPNFSAVGYFFARDLFKARNVPIGLINASVGATSAATWTSRDSLESNPELKKIIEQQERFVREYPAKLDQFKADEPKLLEQYNLQLEKAQKENTTLPRKPSPPNNPVTSNDRPSSLYNGKVAPIQPFAMSGVLWYQGESNAGHAKQYRALFPALISGWRKAWGSGDFPFLFVQLAPYKGTGPEIRESQLLTWLNTLNTAMAVITDAADGTDIHPPDKRPAGARLSLAARALVYGEKLEYSGPLYDSMTVDGNRVVLSFKHIGSGLVAKDGELKGFTVAGANKQFVPAKAEIQGNTVVVSSDAVAVPKAVRFGWANVPDGNLFNKEGLPASPFRTDVD